ncbi:hypothetical protein B0H16DRAFT_1853024, partial [Mycena metata]
DDFCGKRLAPICAVDVSCSHVSSFSSVPFISAVNNSMLQASQNTLIPDPRLYWESSIGLGWYYRDPVSGAIGPDGATFVPPQTAPTPTDLVNRFLSQSSPPASANIVMSPAPRSPGPSQIRFNESPRANRARGGFQFRARDDGYRGGYHNGTQRQEYYDAQSFEERNHHWGRGGMPRGSRARRQFNPMHVSAPLASAPPPVVAAPFVAVPPPDVTTASRNADGHPAFPHQNAEDAPMEDVVGVVPGAQARAEIWHQTEASRIEAWGRRLQRGDLLPRNPMALDPAHVGVWATLTITSVAQAHNLMRWSDAGCPYSWAIVLFLQQEYGLRPLAYRTAGVGLILSLQAGSLARHTQATQGILPVSQRAARRAEGFVRRRDTPAVLLAPPASSATVTPINSETALVLALTPTISEDVVMSVESAFLGTSPAGDDAGDFNSRVSVEEADVYWASVTTVFWPKALRNVAGEYPTQVVDIPLTDDSRVVFTLRIFGPTTEIALDQFIEKTMTLFSCAGLFGHYCTVGGYRLMSRGPEHYNFITSSIDWAQVASWWCTHGIAPGSPAVLAFESYAKSYRNHIEGHRNPGNEEFLTYPNRPSCLKTHPNGHITRWKLIEHGDLYGALQSTYPRRPSMLFTDDDKMDGRKTPTQDRLDWSEDTDPAQSDKPSFKFGTAASS